VTELRAVFHPAGCFTQCYTTWAETAAYKNLLLSYHEIGVRTCPTRPTPYTVPAPMQTTHIGAECRLWLYMLTEVD